MKKYLNQQRGAIPIGIAVLFLVTSLVGLAAGYKAVQSPTNIVPQAKQYTCTELTQYPNRKCEETLAGPCNYGDWKYQCTSPKTQGPCASDAGVGVPYWCDGTTWHNMNYYGECTTECKPPTTESTPAPTSGGTGGSGRCFYLTAQFNKTSDGDFDAWVSFNSDDTSGFDDIQLSRNGAYVAGYDRWNKSTGPFTYQPGQYTGGRIPASSTISFSGRDDNCGERGNFDSITCTVNADGSVTSNTPGRCFQLGGSQSTPTNTPIPTNIPTPTIIRKFPPTNTPSPTPTVPLNAACGYPPMRCCLLGDDTYPPACHQGICVDQFCVYPTATPTPTNTPTPTKTSSEEGITKGTVTPTPESTTNNFARNAQRTVQQIFGGASQEEETTVKDKPTTISGKVTVNNSLETPVSHVYITLHSSKEDTEGFAHSELTDNKYAFDNLDPNKQYIIKAWAKTSDNKFYQNNPCTLISQSKYNDCVVKTGDIKNLTIDIGNQGIRKVSEQIQETSKKAVSSLQSIPVIGPFIQMFITSAF